MWVIVALLMLSVPVVACDKGCVPQEGVCACEPPAADAAVSVKPDSDVAPEGWHSPGIHVDMPQSLAEKDTIADEQKSKADRAGKEAAGIR